MILQYLVIAALLAEPGAALGLNTTDPCLCVFDIDRTLTGEQGSANTTCPADKEITGVPDEAYDGGTLTASALAQGLSGTFCGSCFLGVCSAGDASGAGSKERDYLLNAVLGGTARVGGADRWNEHGTNPLTGRVNSALVVRQSDGHKQKAVQAIVDWYASGSASKVKIAAQNVFFFDDRADNIQAFAGTGFNAKQVSCKSRTHNLGLCGGTADEVVRVAGVNLCESL